MTFAGLLMIVGMSALGRALFKKPREITLWLPIFIIAGCLLLTLTRQAWLGFLMGLVFLIYTRKKVYLLALPFIVTLVILVSPGEVKHRLENMASGKDFTFFQRVALWQGGWKIFNDHPLTGCGFRCVDLINSQYPDPTGYIKQIRGMHNNFVQLAVDTGLLGLTSWMGIWFCFFRLLYERSAALKHDPPSCWVLVGSAAAGIAFLTGGCFESNFYDSEVVMVLYFIMALPFCGSQNNEIAYIKNDDAPAQV
jgi:O-antigen ligase